MESPSSSTRSCSGISDVRCTECGQTGHVADECEPYVIVLLDRPVGAKLYQADCDVQELIETIRSLRSFRCTPPLPSDPRPRWIEAIYRFWNRT